MDQADLYSPDSTTPKNATQGPQLNRPKIRGESKAILQRRSGKDHPDSKGKHGVGRNGITEDIPGSAWKHSNDFTVAEKKIPTFCRSQYQTMPPLRGTT